MRNKCYCTDTWNVVCNHCENRNAVNNIHKTTKYEELISLPMKHKKIINKIIKIIEKQADVENEKQNYIAEAALNKIALKLERALK